LQNAGEKFFGKKSAAGNISNFSGTSPAEHKVHPSPRCAVWDLGNTQIVANQGNARDWEMTMKTNQNHTYRLMKLTLVLGAFLLLLTSATWAAPRETDPIWRVQFRVQTADVSDAGTDDSVRVALNLNNNTWLDYGRDDFPRNNTFTYDLKLDNVATIADLSHLYLSKTGSDGLALKSIALLVNGRLIYTQQFATAFWLDNDGGHSNTFVVNYSQLRQDDAWRNYFQPFPPFVIDRPELESRIESIMGDAATGNRLQWGHKYGRAYVEATKARAPNTVHIDLDMELDIPGYFNPEVDIDFDLQVLCVNNQVQLKMLNPKVVVDSDFIAELLSLNLISLLDGYLTTEMNKALKGVNLSRNISVPTCPVIKVVNVTVSGQTEVQIQFSLPPLILVAQPLVIGTQAKMRAGAETTASKNEAVEDGAAPLTLAIETPDSFDTDNATPYTLVLKSQRPEPGQINVRIALPVGVNVNEGIIEIEDANGNRTLAAGYTTGEAGETVLIFQDQIAPGAEPRYRLHFRFLSGLATDLQLVATVSDEAGLTFNSTTYFQLNEGVIKQRGTFQTTKGLAAKPTKLVNNEQ
jgi:hypothetical protein